MILTNVALEYYFSHIKGLVFDFDQMVPRIKNRFNNLERIMENDPRVGLWHIGKLHQGAYIQVKEEIFGQIGRSSSGTSSLLAKRISF